MWGLKGEAALGLSDILRRSKRVWRPLLAIAVVQAVFWLIYHPLIVERPAMPPLAGEAHAIVEGPLDEPTMAAVGRAALHPVELPLEVCCEPGYRALRFSLDLDEVPERGLVLMPGFGADNHFLYVNGAFADGRGRLELPDITYHHNDFRMIRIMPGLLKPGANEFVVIVVRSTGIGFDYFPIMAFDARDFQAPHERREFIIGTFAWMQLAAALLVSVLALLLLLRSSERAAPFWLFAVSSCWALHQLFYKWSDPPFDGDFRLAYSCGIFVLLGYACFGWAHAWSGRRLKGALAVATVFAVVSLGVVFWAAYAGPLEHRFDQANTISSLGSLGLSIAAVLQLLWGALYMDQRRAWELAFSLPLPMGLALDMYGEVTEQARWGISELSQPLLVTGLLAAFFARNIHLFRSQEQINSLLQEELAARTGELEAAHARERVRVREQAHEAERQRILRDMHDGLGSQLMSMLLAAKRGNLAPERMAEGLQAVVDEMRLMIQSMDSVGESLTSALALFKERVGSRLTEAGMALKWRDELVAAPPHYSPREVLQVFRIMQEAGANAMKHARASAIEVTVAPRQEPEFPVRILVADNGVGFSSADERGRGLDNMRRRAASIGARLEVRSTPAGVEVELDLPARNEEKP